MTRYSGFIFIFFFNCALLTLHGQTTWMTSSYDLALGKADRFSTGFALSHLHPGLSAIQDGWLVSANAGNRFSGFGISTVSLFINHNRNQNIGTGIGISRFGNENYKATTVTASLGKKLGKSVIIGIGQSLEKTKIIREGRPWSGNSAISVAYLENDWGLMLCTDKIIRFGSYGQTWRDIVFDSAGFLKVNDQTTFFALLHYQSEKWHPVLALRQSIYRNVELIGSVWIYPARYGVGFTLPLSDYFLAITGLEYHPVLGWTSSIGIQWNSSIKDAAK